MSNPDFSSGQINVASLVKPHRIFTADPGIVIRKIGKLKSGKIKEIEMSIVKIFES